MSEPVPKLVRRRWRPWKVLLGVFVALVIGFFGWQWYREAKNEARLKAAIEATDRVDPQWRMADLVKEYLKLPVSDGFVKVLNGIGAYRGWYGDDFLTREGALDYDPYGIDFNVRLPESYFKILQERLQDPLLTTLRDELKQYVLEPPNKRIALDDNNFIQKTRAVTNYLRDEMELAAHQGSYEKLIPLLDAGLRLSASPYNAPQIIYQLVGVACKAHSLAGIPRALALGNMSAETLKKLQQKMEEYQRDNLVAVLRTICADNYSEIEQAKRSDAARAKVRESITFDLRLPHSPTINERIDYFHKWIEVESTMNNLSLAQAELLESVNEAVSLAQFHPEKITPFLEEQVTKRQSLISRGYLRVISKLVIAEQSIQNGLRTHIVALACERYRLVTGVWPIALTDLQPIYIKDIPLDPFSGKALLYRQLPDGVVVYSLGINRVDDGGEVLSSVSGPPKDRGVKLFNPALRDRRYEDVYPERTKPE